MQADDNRVNLKDEYFDDALNRAARILWYATNWGESIDISEPEVDAIKTLIVEHYIPYAEDISGRDGDLESDATIKVLKECGIIPKRGERLR